MSNTIQDSKGRTIEVRQVRGSLLGRLTRIAGSAWGENLWTTATLGRATITAIDGVPVNPKPINSIEDLDRLWDEIDEQATGAAVEWMIENAKTVAADAKNSLAPQDSASVSGS